MKNLLQRIEDTEKKYYINHPKATETDSMVYVLKTLKDDSTDSILTCYQFLDRIKNAKKDIKSISTNINDKNRQEQLIDEELKEQIESILSEYSAFGFDYDTIFNHMCNY